MIRRIKSYSKRVSSKQSKNFNRRRREKRFFISLAITFSVAGLVFGLSKISSLNALAINSIEVYGTSSDNAANIVAAADKVLKGKYLGVFNKSNAFIYPDLSIKDAVKSVSPDVERVESKINQRHTLVISITEKNPAAVICNNLPDFRDNELVFDENENCSFVDSLGNAFNKETTFSGSAYKRYYAPELKELNENPENFGKLQKFYDSVLEAGIKAQAILVKSNGEYELYAYNPAKAGSEGHSNIVVIYFNSESGFSVQLANLVSFWLSAIKDSQKGQEALIFDSIDVRYGSNVFYRLNK